MDQIDIINKLRQIEDHARDAVADMPAGTPRERVRLIMAIAAHVALKLEIHARHGVEAASNDDQSFGDGTQPPAARSARN